jgi:hypothetical protein
VIEWDWALSITLCFCCELTPSHLIPFPFHSIPVPFLIQIITISIPYHSHFIHTASLLHSHYLSIPYIFLFSFHSHSRPIYSSTLFPFLSHLPPIPFTIGLKSFLVSVLVHIHLHYDSITIILSCYSKYSSIPFPVHSIISPFHHDAILNPQFISVHIPSTLHTHFIACLLP